MMRQLKISSIKNIFSNIDRVPLFKRTHNEYDIKQYS